MTAYGGELRYTVFFESSQRSLVIDGQPDVVLQGNDIFLEHYSQTKPLPRVPHTVTVTFREVRVIAVWSICTLKPGSSDTLTKLSCRSSDAISPHGVELMGNRVLVSTC